jgi:hypothetical protein
MTSLVMELTVQKIAELVSGEVVGDGDFVIKGVSPFDDAGPDDITFAASARYKKRLEETHAAAVIVSLEILESKKILVRVFVLRIRPWPWPKYLPYSIRFTARWLGSARIPMSGRISGVVLMLPSIQVCSSEMTLLWVTA